MTRTTNLRVRTLWMVGTETGLSCCGAVLLGWSASRVGENRAMRPLVTGTKCQPNGGTQNVRQMTTVFKTFGSRKKHALRGACRVTTDE